MTRTTRAALLLVAALLTACSQTPGGGLASAPAADTAISAPAETGTTTNHDRSIAETRASTTDIRVHGVESPAMTQPTDTTTPATPTADPTTTTTPTQTPSAPTPVRAVQVPNAPSNAEPATSSTDTPTPASQAPSAEPSATPEAVYCPLPLVSDGNGGCIVEPDPSPNGGPVTSGTIGCPSTWLPDCSGPAPSTETTPSTSAR